MGRVSSTKIFQSHLKFADKERKKRYESKVLATTSGVKLNPKNADTIRYLVDPDLGFNVKTLRSFVAELPPGGHNTKHRHFSEALIFIISGKGYSVIEDKRYEWKAGDMICVPVWAWHQHFNSDSDRPVRYIAVTNSVLMENIGLFDYELQKV